MFFVSLVNAFVITSSKLESLRKFRKKKAPEMFQMKITRVQITPESLIKRRSRKLVGQRMSARNDAIPHPRGPTYLPDFLNPARPVNTTIRGRIALKRRSHSATEYAPCQLFLNPSIVRIDSEPITSE